MTHAEADELLRTREPHPYSALDSSSGKTVTRYSFAHELCYYDDFIPPANFLPEPIFDLLPGVKPGPRFSTGILAGNPFNGAPPNQGSYTVDFPTEELANAALAEAVRKWKEANPEA